MTPEEEKELFTRMVKLEEQVLVQDKIIGSCQMDVHNKLQEHDLEFDKIEDRFDEQSKERAKQNEQVMEAILILKAQNEASKEWQDKHGEEEKAQISKLYESINELKGIVIKIDDQTKANTAYVTSKTYNEELEQRVAEKINEANKPIDDIKQKAILTAVTIITGSVVIGAWKMILFISSLEPISKG